MLVGLNRSVNKDNCTGEGYGGRAAGLRLKEEDLGLSVGRSVGETLWCSRNSAIQGLQRQSGSGRFEDFLNCGRERRRASRQRKGEEEAIKI